MQQSAQRNSSLALFHTMEEQQARYLCVFVKEARNLMIQDIDTQSSDP